MLRTFVVRVIAGSCLAAATLTLPACSSRLSIESINRKPVRFHHHEVTIGGRVVNSFATAGINVFEIDDGTGRMWVYTRKNTLPGDESRVIVTGILQQDFTIAGRNFANIMYETRRRD